MMIEPTNHILKIAKTPAAEHLNKKKRHKRRDSVQRVTPEEMDVEIKRVRIENSGLAIATGTGSESDSDT
jgi:hypothetical protein